ncbi:hypothetical protein QV000_07220 [Stenotrophomonas maltophilia]
MSTDKTLADVQPGGRVRLATVPYDRARDLLGDAYNAGTHGIGYSQQIMELHDAVFTTRQPVGEPVAWRNHGAAIDAKALATATEISLMWGQDRSQFVSRIQVAVIEAMRWMDGAVLSAQPSPDGQDALGVAASEMLDLLRSIPEEELLALDCDPHPPSSLSEAAKTLEAALAARQPVTMDDALAAGDGTLHGAIDHWQERALRAEAELAARQPVGEPVAWMHTHKTTGQVKFGLSPMYDCDFNAENWDSVALYAAPAQAVDLGPMRDVFRRWHANELNSTDAMLALVEALALIDSQAVGNG